MLDLASGSGLVAIAAAVAGAASVTPSETDSLAVAAIKLNAGVNRVRLEPTVGDLLAAPVPGKQDAGRPDAGRPDERADAVRANVGRADAVHADVVRADAVRANVGRADAVHADVVRADAVHADVVRADAVHADVVRADAVRADVVLAGDAFYDRSMASQMLPFLQRASQAGALVLIGDPGRAYLPGDRFAQVTTYDVPVERVIEDADVKHTTVWRLR